MEIGIHSFGELVADPHTHHQISAHERLKIVIRMATMADEVGLDVFGFGEHHRLDFVASAPLVVLARLRRPHPVKHNEDSSTMQDTSLTPNTTDRSQAGEEPGKPLAPLWIFKMMNPIMKALLRSPLHRWLDGTLVLLTYTGRKTGKQYTIPIGYFVWGEGELMSFSSARWWTNLRGGAPVTLLLKGRRVQAVPTVIEEHEAVIDLLEEFIKRLGLRAARRLPIGLPHDREPTRDDLRNVPRGIALVHFQLA